MLFLLPLFFLISCSQETLPKIQVRTLEGKEVYLSDYKGQKILIYVWSRTCVGHSEHLRKLNDLQEKKKDHLIISYAVAMEPEDVIKSYQELDIKPRFLTLVDTEVRFNDYFPITFLPSTYIFDEKGRFVSSHPGLYIP
ncbi:TlpA family protein disulfide reductase [Hydrogenobacter sp. T-8]|nr:TlpA family protein disulfide reductase [Hydrogenobacter sp. T-8]